MSSKKNIPSKAVRRDRTIDREAFALYIVQGVSASEAYVKAGGGGKKDSIRVAAANLKKHPEVQAHIADIRDNYALRLQGITIARAHKFMEEDFPQIKEPKDKLFALREISKLSGLDAIKHLKSQQADEPSPKQNNDIKGIVKFVAENPEVAEAFRSAFAKEVGGGSAEEPGDSRPAPEAEGRGDE